MDESKVSLAPFRRIMKTRLAIFGLGLVLGIHTIQAQDFSAEKLKKRAMERRAVEAVIWGIPAVNYERMLEAAVRNGAKLNEVVYWSRPVNSKNQTLTLTTDLEGCSEVGGLFLHPSARAGGLGALLARSRYLFINLHRARR